MIVEKITPGFVVQNFDTEKKDYVSQNFEAGDQVSYEVDGNPLTREQEEEAGDAGIGICAVANAYERYLPFDMVQPNSNPDKLITALRCAHADLKGMIERDIKNVEPTMEDIVAAQRTIWEIEQVVKI